MVASKLIRPEERARTLSAVFLLSGVSALIYQFVWQRRLLTLFGVNIESVTVIVSVFMAGLGMGALLGGKAAEKFSPIRFFISAELLIGLFGVLSVPLLNQLNNPFIIGGILIFPTILMGTTLPVLVSHLTRLYNSLGKSVSSLYAMNTLGASLGCFLTTDVLFVHFGLKASAAIAALINVTVAFLAYRLEKG
jgi:predicted membrane-bound spermidine synthase